MKKFIQEFNWIQLVVNVVLVSGIFTAFVAVLAFLISILNEKPYIELFQEIFTFLFWLAFIVALCGAIFSTILFAIIRANEWANDKHETKMHNLHIQRQADLKKNRINK